MRKKFILQYIVKPWKEGQKIRDSRDKNSEIFNRLKSERTKFHTLEQMVIISAYIETNGSALRKWPSFWQ